MNFFNIIVKRVANFSIQSYEINKHNLYDFFKTNELFKLCILTASDSLHSDLSKHKSEKTESSLFNYFTRAHINPTPFGVFNSVGILNWGDTTNITKTNKLHLLAKYDNLFISSKMNENFNNNWIHLNYCPNPTIYFLNDEKIGFYKSKTQDNDKIEIIYNEIDFDEDLLWLLNQFKDGKKIDIVAEELILQGFIREEVEAFLLETIETGIIIETFLFNSYTTKLNKPYQHYFSELIVQNKHLLETNNDIVNFEQAYIDEQNVFFEKNKPKNFYAINCFDSETVDTLDINIQNKVNKYIDFAIQYNSQTNPINDKLVKFINKVQDRFNDGFIPFNTIFNPYSGINYNDIKTENELKLHEDIVLKILASTESSLYLNLPTNENVDIKSTKLPASFSVILETLICKDSGESIIYIRNLGYPSALDMISRFSDITQQACQDVITYEKEIHKDKIIADINCVGNFRSINVAPTEQRYDYCLPINTAYTEDSNPILLSDIYVHLQNNNLSLVSKKHQKQVLPKKVSAINSKLLDSDIYNFLCDYELYNQEIYSLNFNFNSYPFLLPFIPRIYLEKGILLYPSQILLVFNNYNLEEFKDYLMRKIEEYSFLQKVILKDSQREIVIDIKNHNSISILYEKLKKNKHFYVSEFLYDFFDSKITRETENFAHELVIGVKNLYYNRQNIDYSKMDISLMELQNTAVVSDWLYLELYCNAQADSEIFNVIYNKVILENKVDLFFFVNFYIPDRHLRFRFKTNSIENKQCIITIVQDLKLKNIISKYHILPYNQEIHRYGGLEMLKLSEIIFNLDSRDYLENIITKNLDEKKLKIIAVLKIKYYLYFFNFTLDDAINYCENSIKNFSKEFELTTELRKDFNKEYADIKIDILNYAYESFLKEEKLREIYHNQLKISTPDVNSSVWPMIHMSMNRHFNKNQRFNEFKTYYLTKCHLNQLKFTKKNNS
ncbi:thiopeptide-type bacteriocin biosynthesis protein [Flavobacterium psychrophilum]|uniref:thiopeptide-type bacteriocin biosynthesis protein n=1 Tax=Flavobacterium psychrophilum TaxID=96345 RepID=UPI002BA7BB51|nr:thiopeptide-type bacteriocin biosynthesis protein [Flavobacterium psychrophilum]